MIIQNNGKPFLIGFNSNEYEVPAGKFEVTAALGHHTKKKSLEWNLDVEMIETAEDKQAITTGIISKEEPVEDKVEEPKKEEPNKVEESKEKVIETKNEKPTQTKKAG